MTAAPEAPLATRFRLWRRSARVQALLVIALALLGPALAGITFLVVNLFRTDTSPLVLRAIVLADMVYVLIIAGLVAQRVARVVAARRAKSAGSRLHLRLTGVFALMALVPTVLVAVFATLTINFGLEGWFSERVRNVVGTSLAAAQAYKQEHADALIADADALAAFLDSARARTSFPSDGFLREMLAAGQAQIQRGLKEAYVIDGGGTLRARGERSYLFDYEPPTPEQIARAKAGETVLIEDWDNNEFRALVALNAYVDRLLYISRAVDGGILNLLDETQATVALYQQLERERGTILFEFAIIYLAFAVILILAAVWLGMWFAERLSRPVGRLAGAAQRVGAGDLDVRVREEEGDDEIAMLGRVFNQMTRQLRGQREALVAAHAASEARRRLFDSVLSGVTSGVIGLDAAGRIDFLNPACARLLELDRSADIGRPLAEAVPEFAPLLDELAARNAAETRREMRLTRSGRQEALLVRAAARRGEDGGIEGYVIAFDDVTDLEAAQRMAAWGDVARRIAHEIKNPLTPIRLSAERLRRKFAPIAGEHAEALEQYTEVIVRQTDDLRRIVDEFSRFARMPQPRTAAVDLSQIVAEAVHLERARGADLNIELATPAAPVIVQADRGMLVQAFTNLVKNAGEAIAERREKDPEGAFQGEIRVQLFCRDGQAVVEVADNGIGLPPDRARLFEPYVTTRASGTGLGLPIVRKIIEEHGGQLALEDAPPFGADGHCGALARVVLPLAAAEGAAAAAPDRGATTTDAAGGAAASGKGRGK